MTYNMYLFIGYIAWLALVSLISFSLFLKDKKMAQKGSGPVRVKEKTLLASCVFGGAIGGAIGSIPKIGAGISAAVIGFSSTFIGMNFENVIEDEKNSIDEILTTAFVNGAISGLLGSILDELPINHLTKGRGSYSAISKQINTKFSRNIINKISFKTFGKMFSYNSYLSSLGSIYNLFTDGLVFKLK